MKKLVIFLIRKRLGLKKMETFTFVGQKSPTYYFFTDDALIKVWRNTGNTEKAHVSLNYILSDECTIIKDSSV